MNFGRLFVIRCSKGTGFLSVPAGRKPAVYVPLAEARFFKDLPTARRLAADANGEAVPVDLTVNTSVQTYTHDRDRDRFSFARNGASCDPPPGWREVPADRRIAFLSATGWIPL